MNEIVYDGELPYIFISYSHKDEQVLSYIHSVQRELYRIWFDHGNKAGQDWAKTIANKLEKSNCILLFVSKNSIESINIKNEIIFAQSINKLIIPIFIEDFELSSEYKMLLSSYHQVKIAGLDFKDSVKKIVENLPKETLSISGSPFYVNDRYEFYFKTIEIADKGYGYYTRETSIVAVDLKSKDSKKLYSYVSIPAYEPVFKICRCEKVNPTFFNEDDNQNILLDFIVDCLLEYPLKGDDVSALFSYIISNPLSDDVKVIPVGYKIVSPKTNVYKHDLSMDKLYKDTDALGRTIIGDIKESFFGNNKEK